MGSLKDMNHVYKIQMAMLSNRSVALYRCTSERSSYFVFQRCLHQDPKGDGREMLPTTTFLNSFDAFSCKPQLNKLNNMDLLF